MNSQHHHYRRHAELYGTELVYEVALTDGFEAHELGHLALALRRLDPKWRLTPAQREDLFHRLLPSQLPDKRLREVLGISQDTLRRLSKAAFQSGVSAAKTGYAENGPDVPILLHLDPENASAEAVAA